MGFPPPSPGFDPAISLLAFRKPGSMVGDTYDTAGAGATPETGFPSFTDATSFASKVYSNSLHASGSPPSGDITTEMREWGSPGKSPMLPMPDALPQVSQSRIPRKRFATEESYVAIPPNPVPTPGGPAVLSPAAPSNDDEVIALLPKMKRMRLRPSLGQLRLEREAEELRAQAKTFSTKEISVQVEPTHLTATLELRKSLPGEQVLAVSLLLNFPPQYPHKPPTIKQTTPSYPLACWAYEGGNIQLPRLVPASWSPAMGLQDILLDLIAGPSDTMAAGLGASQAAAAGREVPLIGSAPPVLPPRYDLISQGAAEEAAEEDEEGGCLEASAKGVLAIGSSQDSLGSAENDVEMA